MHFDLNIGYFSHFDFKRALNDVLGFLKNGGRFKNGKF